MTNPEAAWTDPGITPPPVPGWYPVRWRWGPDDPPHVDAWYWTGTRWSEDLPDPRSPHPRRVRYLPACHGQRWPAELEAREGAETP